MDVRDAIEQAYKNGYEQGKKDAFKHGRWIDGADSFGAPRGKYRVCSVCNICIPKTVEVPDQYWQGCPNCLSKMDGGNTDA